MHDAHPIIRLTAESSGFVLTCECQWVKFYVTRPAADQGLREHAAKCTGPKAKREPKPARPASRTKWDDREGATWIDQL